jgi:hypothetical protein
MKVLSAGSSIGRFHVIRALGRGSMGVVYLATDPRIGRPIALKTFLPEGGPSDFSREEMEEVFLREARLAGRLQHPNVVTVYDVGRARDVPFIVMEYVEGEPLKTLLTAHVPISLAESLWIVRQVSAALGHAHEKSVLHRDVKPGNILVPRDGPVKVTDFGVGKLLASVTSGHTQKGMIVGSPAYMSPEQIREEKLDARSDFFSLGVVTYELLTGSRPFRGDTLASLAYNILNAEPMNPRVLRPDLPQETADVFRRLLSRSPEGRPADAREFARELDRLSAGAPKADAPSPALADAIERLGREKQKALEASVRAEPTGTGSAAAQPSTRRLAWPLAAGLAAVLALAWFTLLSRRRPGVGEPAVTPPSSAITAAVPTAVPEAVSSLPTPGGAAAASPLVGSPRTVTSGDASVTGDSARRRGASDALIAGGVERVYRARAAARFAVRPEQARIWVDGRYVGIADDWDGWGGGVVFPLAAGLHRVRLELPGFRTLGLAILATPDASAETVKIEDRLERRGDAAYARLGRPDARTRGLLELQIDPPAAVVSAGGKRLGVASSFTAARPLRLSGTAVHEIEISAPDHERRVLRVLVSPNAGTEKARVSVRLRRR